jgi:hypothetical protein
MLRTSLPTMRALVAPMTEMPEPQPVVIDWSWEVQVGPAHGVVLDDDVAGDTDLALADGDAGLADVADVVADDLEVPRASAGDHDALDVRR